MTKNTNTMEVVTFKNAIVFMTGDETRVMDIKYATREMMEQAAGDMKMKWTINNQWLSPKNRDHIWTLIGTDEYRVTTLKPADPTMYKLQFKRMTEWTPKVVTPVVELKAADTAILTTLIETYGIRSIIAATKKQK